MNHNDQPITKREIAEIMGDIVEQNILTGVEELIKESHDSLSKQISTINNKVSSLDNKMENLKNQLTREFIAISTKNKDEIITSNDRLAGEIKKDREELMATVMSSKQANNKYREYDQTLIDHESRIKTLELKSA